MQITDSKWNFPKEMIPWITIALVASLILTVLIGWLWVHVNKDQSHRKVAGRNLRLPRDIPYACSINLGGKAPIIAVQKNTTFSYLDFSMGEPAMQLDRTNLPEDRAVISFIDESSSWRWLQTLFIDLKNNGISRTFVTCTEGHVPVDIPNGRKFTGHMLLELQDTGKIIDITTGSKYLSCNDATLLMECRGVMIMDQNYAIIVSGNNKTEVGDFVRLYSNIQGVLPSRQRSMVFLKMPGFESNPISANQHMAFTVETPVD